MLLVLACLTTLWQFNHSLAFAQAGEEAAGDDQFALGTVAGTVEEAADLPKGVLALKVLDTSGQPLPSKEVKLGAAMNDNQVRVYKAVSDASGLTRFKDLPVGQAAGYAAVVEHEGLRLGTEPFRMPADKGMRGQIRALGRTTDPTILRIEPRSKVVLEVREGPGGAAALAMAQSLVFKNVSDKIFDPGDRGLLIPLPEGATGAQELPRSEPLDLGAKGGVALKAPIPPSSGVAFASQANFGFVLPTSGTSSFSVRQPLPFGMESPLILVLASTNLTMAAPGLRMLPDEKDPQGNIVKMYELPKIAPGGVLAFTVGGLPAHERQGQIITAVLCLLLIAGAFVAGWRQSATHGQDRDAQTRLVAEREKLFAELVALERERRAAQGTGVANGVYERRRTDLVEKLESVYRDLDGLDRGSAAPS